MEGYPGRHLSGSPDSGDLIFDKQSYFQLISPRPGIEPGLRLPGGIPVALAVCLVVGARVVDLLRYW